MAYPDDDDRTPAGPSVPVPGGDEDALIKRCTEDRDKLTPHETADCVGAEIAEKYLNDEDGGS